jgi:DNA-binding NtrC family response regulator
VRKHGTQIIAIAATDVAEEQGTFFSVRIVLPPLAERPEDIPPLVEKFKKEILELFGESDGDFTVDTSRLDLSGNAFSLRRSVMLQYLMGRVDEEELLGIIESFLDRRMEGEEDLYRKMLYLYEVPLIRAGTKRYKSQLKMSQVFGLNRNTLRKKIQEWRRYLTL